MCWFFVRLISLRNLTKAMYETEGEIEFHDIRQVTDQNFRQLEDKWTSSVGDSLPGIFTRRPTIGILRI